MPIRDVDGSRQDPPVLWKKHVCWAAESCAGVKSRSGEARERKELLKKGLYVSTHAKWSPAAAVKADCCFCRDEYGRMVKMARSILRRRNERQFCRLPKVSTI